jgi:hypothetical protein
MCYETVRLKLHPPSFIYSLLDLTGNKIPRSYCFCIPRVRVVVPCAILSCRFQLVSVNVYFCIEFFIEKLESMPNYCTVLHK